MKNRPAKIVCPGSKGKREEYGTQLELHANETKNGLHK